VRRLDTHTASVGEVVIGMQRREAPFEVFTRTSTLDGRPWRFPNPYRDDLFQRIDAAGEHLDRVCFLGKGMETAANKVFGKLSDDDVERLKFPRELLKRRARNSDIQAFHVGDSGENILYLEDVATYAALPHSVRDYLEHPSNEQILKARAAYVRGDCEWWRYAWPLHKDHHTDARLISPYRTGHTRFALDVDHSYFTSTDTTIVFERDGTREDLRYVQGLLNSKLMTFRFRGLAKLTSPNLWEAFHYSIQELPIRRIDFDDPGQRGQHDAVVRLADDIAAASAARGAAFTAADRSLAARRAEGLTDQLDELVLDLYGISHQEERASVLAMGAPL
jgi:hypothetical protein